MAGGLGYMPGRDNVMQGNIPAGSSRYRDIIRQVIQAMPDRSNIMPQARLIRFIIMQSNILARPGRNQVMQGNLSNR